MKVIWFFVSSLLLIVLLSESEAAPKRGRGRRDDEGREEPEEHARKRRNVIHGMNNKGLLLKRLGMDNELGSHRVSRAVARADSGARSHNVERRATAKTMKQLKKLIRSSSSKITEKS